MTWKGTEEIMNFDFETLVERRPSNMKRLLTPDGIEEAGNISLDGAEPDFKTAPSSEEAMIRFAKNGLYGFTICDSTYRDSVVWWMENSRKTKILPEWIVPTMGTIYSVATAIRLCCPDKEDGIILTSPVYNRYKQAADRLYRRTTDCPLICEGDSFRMDFDAIETAMQNPKNRLFILCNPHNPIGQIWRMEELEKLADLANRYDVTVFSDEIFADNCYQGLTCPCYLDVPGAQKHGIVATSLGKSFGFTGVNHANVLIADEELRARFQDRRTRDHYGSMDPMVYECVLAAYSEEGKAWLEASNRYVEENITMVKEFFAEHLPKAAVYGGEAAYILWVDWRAYFDQEEELDQFLKEKAHVCLGEGSDYDRPGFTRICVATPHRYMKRTLESIGAAWNERENFCITC